MKISELLFGPVKDEIVGTVSSIGDTRAFEKFGKQLKVANAILGDDSGKVKISLWNEDIMKISNGNKVKVSNGYVSEFQGEKQLSAGKFGKIEVLKEESSGSEEGLL